MKQFGKGCQITVQRDCAQQTAQLHLLFLTLRVAAPVEPVQVLGLQRDSLGLFDQGFEVVLRCGCAQVHIAQQLVAPRQGNEQVARGELAGARGLALHLQAQRGVEVQGGAVRGALTPALSQREREQVRRGRSPSPLWGEGGVRGCLGVCISIPI